MTVSAEVAQILLICLNRQGSEVRAERINIVECDLYMAWARLAALVDLANSRTTGDGETNRFWDKIGHFDI